ncbi:hypothetical protein [Amnibacterium endophyticum]|uniref:Lipoprotein n=1 Tax=Amnibacterium endophyticum TaxID=2109337 RepID=A0ABW4LFN5_9MICO
MARRRSLGAKSAVVAVALLPLALTACTSPAPVVATPEPSASTSARPVVTASPAAATIPARDRGPREHARGVVIEQQDGVPRLYRVAADDNAGAICHRFGRRWWQLTDRAGTPLGTYPMLQIDEVVGITDAPLSDYADMDLSDTNALC